MLKDQPLKAFIPTKDLAAAKKFYQETLGLELLKEDQYAAEFNAGGTLLRITKVPKLKANTFTVLGWNVNDIKSIAEALKKKGVIFLRYRVLQQDGLGVWTSPNGSLVGWFKDPDGNVLSITQLSAGA